jgi:hypothetical protein
MVGRIFSQAEGGTRTEKRIEDLLDRLNLLEL